MATDAAVLITVREAMERLGWVEPDADPKILNNRQGALMRLCAAKGIVVEQFVPKGDRLISRPQLDAYIATLQP